MKSKGAYTNSSVCWETTKSTSALRHAARVRRILPLLSLLGLYVVIVVLTSSTTLEGDSAGYVDNAARIVHILQGKAIPFKHVTGAQQAGPVDPNQDLRLWWGPGYPLVLTPFVSLQSPSIPATLLNAIFHFAAILYFYALVRRYVSTTVALVAALCLGLYPPLLRNMSAVGPEDLGILLVCGFMFHFCALYNRTGRYRLHLLAASLCLTYLAITKVFFGYVITAMLALCFLAFMWRRTHRLRTATLVFGLALICSVPYLLYTYHLTGKLFYWGTSGGMSLYWMSSPYPNELGSWFAFRAVEESPDLAPHRQFFASLKQLSDVERDEAFKKQALVNMTHHPSKYVAHWAANVGRLLFSYPYSFTPQKLSTYFFLPNVFIAVLFALSIVPALLRASLIPSEYWGLLAFGLVALAGSSLLSAYERQFMPVIPILCLWLTFVYVRVLRVQLCMVSER